jgi:hypothetical protein
VLVWKAKPVVTFSTSSTLTTRMPVRGGQPVGRPVPLPPPALPSGDPTAGLAEVEWRIRK